MLSIKPWNFTSMVRLVLGVFICFFLGSAVAGSWHYAGPQGRQFVAFISATISAVALLGTALVVVGRRWTLDDLMRRLLLMLVCMTAGLAFAAWAQQMAGHPPEGVTGEQMVVGEAVTLVYLVAFLRSEQMNWSDAFGLANRRWQAVLFGIMASCVFLPIGECLHWASAHVMTRFHLEPHEQEAVRALRETSPGTQRLVLGLLALLLAPLFEEILFRGVLYPTIKQAGYPRLALWGVALAFAAIHANLASFVPLLLLALLLTALYERTDNLLAPIAAHAVFNALNFAAFCYLDQRLAQ